MMRLSFALASLLILAGCNDKATDHDAAPARPKARSVIEFLEDPDALKVAWTACRTDPGGMGASAECINAGYAVERSMMLGRERALQSLRR